MKRWLGILVLSFAACVQEGPASPVDKCVAESGQPGTGEPIYINVGGEIGQECEEIECFESEFLPDGPYEPGRGFGWLGDAEVDGRAAWFTMVFPVGTSSGLNPASDPEGYLQRIGVYRSWASGLAGYRVDVPDGVYTVTLMLIEPLFPEPGLRIFDVASDGTTLMPDLDIADRAGQDEIIAVSVQAGARDGRIELEFDSQTEAPALLAGLVVTPATQRVPQPPAGLEVRSGAGEVLVRWQLPEQAPLGWLVERSMDGGGFRPADSRLQITPVFVDRKLAPGQSVAYRVAAVDASCTVGEFAESDTVVVGNPEDPGLPLVDILVDPADLAAIHIEPAENLEVPVVVRAGEEEASGTIRLRGGSTRWLSKRSFRIKFDTGTIDGRSRLKLLAEVPDPTRLWQLLGYDLYQRMGALASRARPVLVRINGDVYGVYDDIEHVGDEFLISRGYRVDDRFRLVGAAFGLTRNDSGQVDLSGYEKKENLQDESPELEALIVWLNTAAEHEVARDLENYLDVPVLVDYLAGQMLMANHDVVDGAHYLVLDPDTGRFLMIPWDFNNDTWSRWWLSQTIFTLFDIGAEPPWWQVNWLWSRAMAIKSFRQAVASRLEELLPNQFGDEMNQAVEEIYQSIQPALQAEPWLWRRRYEDWVTTGPERINDFINARREFLTESMSRFVDTAENGVVLTAIGPGGQFTIENRGPLEVNLETCWLSDEPTCPVKVPLSDLGFMEPGRQHVLTQPGGIIPRMDGGFIGIWCGLYESDDEGEFGYTSPVFYPPLASGTAYLRTPTGWETGEP